MSRLDDRYGRYLQHRRQSQAFRSLRPGAVRGPVRLQRGDRELVNFSSNNYLGLTHHPAVIARARDWSQRFGVGSGASRLVSGSLDLHATVEARIAELKRTEAALLFASGFQANATVLPALFDKEVLGSDVLVFADRLIHASLHHGCDAARVRPIRFRHNDPNHLEELLRRRQGAPGQRFILTESVFSMDGDRADLDALTDLAERYGAFVVVDEAHATGVVGPRGMGLAAVAAGRVDLVMGTCSKALGSFGAFVACSRLMRDYLVNRCAGVIYSTALPPPILGAIDAALEIAPTLEAERRELHGRADHLRDHLRGMGIDTLGSSTPIVPAVIGEDRDAMKAAQDLQAHGLLAVAIRPPAVPPGTARLRFGLSTAHTAQDMQRLLDATRALLARST
jgi:8-amino-7-oxononanoate synthase